MAEIVADQWASAEDVVAGDPTAAAVFLPNGRSPRHGDELAEWTDKFFASSGLDETAEERRLRLPMLPGQRSLNLSNTVAVAVFEAWRQNGYGGGLWRKRWLLEHERRMAAGQRTAEAAE